VTVACVSDHAPSIHASGRTDRPHGTTAQAPAIFFLNQRAAVLASSCMSGTGQNLVAFAVVARQHKRFYRYRAWFQRVDRARWISRFSAVCVTALTFGFVTRTLGCCLLGRTRTGYMHASTSSSQLSSLLYSELRASSRASRHIF
jgi:hypothetical protein